MMGGQREGEGEMEEEVKEKYTYDKNLSEKYKI